MELSDFSDTIQSPSPASSPNNSLKSTSVHPTNSISASNTNNASNIYTFSHQTPSNSHDSVHDVITTVSSPPPKRLKITHSIQTVDRLSQLPDPLIHHILSLIPLKNAVASSILSKRWRYTWTYIPNLAFDYYVSTEDNERLLEYVSFINNTVLLYSKTSNLKRFHLLLTYSNCFARKITTWLRFVMCRNVEEIDLRFLNDSLTDKYRLPQFLFDYKLVKSLKLISCEIVPQGQVSWKMLKELTIFCVALSDELVDKILLGSPVLEYLELNECQGIKRLGVKSTSVRKLVVKGDWTSVDMYGINEDLEISGDNLTSLSLLGTFYRRKLKVVNVGSLVDVRLDFELSRHNEHVEDYEDDSEYEKVTSAMREIFDSVQHVAEVAVGKWCIKALSMCELKGDPSPISKYKLLKVDTYLRYWDLPGIARLLRSSPDLETLVLNMACGFDAKVNVGPNIDETFLFGESDWASQETRFCCLLLNVSTIQFVGFIHNTSSRDLVVPLMKLLLEKARVLKKLIIYPQSYDRCRWWMRGKTKDLLTVAQTLLNFPRSSPEAEIIIHPIYELSYQSFC